MCGVIQPAEFMPEPLFDDLPEKYQSISYKVFTRAPSLSLEGLGGSVRWWCCGCRLCISLSVFPHV
jgi:hypothetical protein